MNPRVEQALDLLRSGATPSIAEACRQSGAAKSTVSDHWKAERGTNPKQEATDRLPEDPDTPDLSEIPVFHLDYSELSSLHMYPMSDIHVGSPHFAEAVWDQWTDYLCHTPAVSMMFNGDGLNAAIIGAVSDVYSEKLTPNEATKVLRRKLAPVNDAGILDGITRGNHEARIWRSAGIDPLDQLADEFGVPYSPHALLLVYHVGDQEYRVFVRHGTGNGAGTVGAQANQLERAARIFQADVFITGHSHTQLAFPRDIFGLYTPPGRKRRPLKDGKTYANRAYTINGERVKREKMLFVSSGSFLSYEPYAAERGFPPAHIGAPRIFLDGSKKDAHASV